MVRENYRPLWLVIIIRKIFEMGLDTIMSEMCPDSLSQFSFTERTSALAPAALVVEHLRRKAIISMLL